MYISQTIIDIEHIEFRNTTHDELIVMEIKTASAAELRGTITMNLRFTDPFALRRFKRAFEQQREEPAEVPSNVYALESEVPA